jgi:hypothetical protein
MLSASFGYAAGPLDRVGYPKELSMRLTQETLGKARAVVFGVVFAIVLIAFALHRLHF